MATRKGGHGRLALRDTNYAIHLRLARRSQERQHPVGVSFGEGQAITALIRADNDVPTLVREEDPDRVQVLFLGHDGVFRLKRDHPAFDRLRVLLGEALRQKARVWFIAQKRDLALLDVLPAGWGVAGSHTRDGGSPATFRFVGGPLDGQSFDHTQVNKVATVVPVLKDSGSRQFLLMPPRDECERIFRGELTKDQVQGALHPYERVFMANGAVEYRDASNGSFEAALQPRDQTVSEEVRARKQAFGELADRFIERLRSTKLTGATEVAFLYQCFDQQGNAFPPIRTSIIPRTTVRFSGDQPGATVFAAAMHLDSLIGNINSLVRNAPTGYVSFPECPGRARPGGGVSARALAHPGLLRDARSLAPGGLAAGREGSAGLGVSGLAHRDAHPPLARPPSQHAHRSMKFVLGKNYWNEFVLPIITIKRTQSRCRGYLI